jgi:phosphoribosylformylglycinamidine synthase
MPRALVMTGFGHNCEAETSHALKLAGWEADRVHLSDLLAEPGRLGDYNLMVFIGGFSYGDHLGAGRALAIRLRHGLAAELGRFVADGGLVLGICNGFQAICKLGLLPGFDPFDPDAPQQVTLMHNDSGVFRDDWVRLKVNSQSPCVFTRGLDAMELPIRHGEGKFMVADDGVMKRLQANRQIVYQYCDASGVPTMEFPANPNGSPLGIAGVCDPEGRIFGTMPHPEAFILSSQHPQAARLAALGQPAPQPLGLEIFRNAAGALAAA